MSMRGRPTLFGRPDGREDILARLAQHRVLGDAPAAEHEWLVDHGATEHYRGRTRRDAQGRADGRT